MVKNKFSRHSLSFGLIVVASILLYPAAQWGQTFAIWIFLALITLAAFIALRNEK